jgi:hypothetical protein
MIEFEVKPTKFQLQHKEAKRPIKKEEEEEAKSYDKFCHIQVAKTYCNSLVQVSF